MKKSIPSPDGPLAEQLSTKRTLASPPMGSATTTETFGHVVTLGGGRLRHLRVQHEVLKPGARSSRPHFHTTREECVLVLGGTVTVVAGERTFTATESEFISFPAGPPVHVLRNDGACAVALLVMSAALEDDRVIFGAEPSPGPALDDDTPRRVE